MVIKSSGLVGLKDWVVGGVEKVYFCSGDAFKV